MARTKDTDSGPAATQQAASSGSPAAKRVKFDYVDTIRILVGEDESEFTVHEEVLVRCSKFFHAACHGGFKEAQEKTVRVPDVDITIFKAYIHWVYTREVLLMTPEEITADTEGQTGMMKVVELYITADVLDDLRLRNACIDYLEGICRDTHFSPGPEIASHAYRNTTADSLLRKAIVQKYIGLSNEDAKSFREISRRVPRDFLADIIYAHTLLDNEEEGGNDNKDACQFHEHNDEVPKCTAVQGEEGKSTGQK